ncbi:MAG: uroporphyrinogen-III C-methyltransferase, partial [Thiohalorhabdaceae bacterium]
MAEEAGNSGPGREAEGAEEVAEAPAEEQEAAATAEQQPPRRGPGRGGLWLALVALVVALGAGGAGAYGFWYFQSRFGEVAERLSAAEQERQAGQKAMAELRKKLKAVRGELQSFQGEKEGLAERLNGLEDRLSTLRQATEELNARLEGGPTYWRLERVESLLLAADRVARLEEDARAAHSALAEADRMLRDLNDPAWLEVREAIQNAMTRLEQVPNVDVPGVAFRLASL